MWIEGVGRCATLLLFSGCETLSHALRERMRSPLAVSLPSISKWWWLEGLREGLREGLADRDRRQAHTTGSGSLF